MMMINLPRPKAEPSEKKEERKVADIKFTAIANHQEGTK